MVSQARIAPGLQINLQAVRSPANARLPSAPHAVEEGPRWNTLSPAQQQALAPLAERWPLLSETQKLHWLKLGSRFHSLPAEEQARIQARLTDWANLSLQQRSQARLNYAVTNRLSPADKRAQWEAYQALTQEARQQLAATAAPKPTGAATAVRPSTRKKLARVPAASHAAPDAPNLPKIRPPETLAPPPPPAAPPTPAVPVVVHTAPVSVPSAIPEPLPPLLPEDTAAPEGMADSHAPLSDAAQQYAPQ